jgi:glucose-6-phosphate 1-dehydrogenase
LTSSIGTLLVLGASGDLAGRLLLPAVGQLLKSSHGPAALTLVGAGAEVFDEATWRARVAAAFAAVHASGPRVDEIAAWSTYLTADVTRPQDLQRCWTPAMARRRCISRCRRRGLEGLRCLGQVPLPGGDGVLLGKPFRLDQASAAMCCRCPLPGYPDPGWGVTRQR